MPAKIEKIECKFIGEFKVGDNLVRNADALCKLSAGNENGVFNKLMVIQAGSIVEAALNEIIYRAQNFNKEKVTNISEADRKAIAEGHRQVLHHHRSHEEIQNPGWSRRGHIRRASQDQEVS